MHMMHIICLDEETLANKIYREQMSNNWPGLAKETEDICTKLGIESVHATRLDAKTYRKVVTEAVHEENKRRLLKAAENKTKCENMTKEDYGKKEYLKEKSIKDSRAQYKARYKMTSFAGNFKNDKRFSKSNWLCKCKMEIEEESHLMEESCPVYGNIRQKYGDLKMEDDLVSFFSDVLEERERLDDEERNPGGGEDATDGASGGSQPPPASLGPTSPANCNHLLKYNIYGGGWFFGSNHRY